MFRLHLTRTLRSLAFFAVLGLVVAGFLALWWVNHTGLPQAWREAIERQITLEHGMHVKIGSLSYWPLQGVAASDVAWFSDADCRHEVSRVERIILDIDQSGLMRKEFRLRGIQLRNARLSLPVNPDDPKPEMLQIHRVNGTLRMPGNRHLEIRQLRGRVAGVEVLLDATMVGYRQESAGQPKTEQPTATNRPVLEFLRELGRWHFNPLKPPVLRITMEGDLNQPGSLAAEMTLDAERLEKNQREVRNLQVQAKLTGHLLTVSNLQLEDGRGRLQARFDYDVDDRSGRFWLDSGLELPGLLSAWLGRQPPGALLLGGRQTVRASGEVSLPKGGLPRVRMTGTFDCASAMLRGVVVDRATGKFSWNEGDLFLRDLRLERQDGVATGKAFYQAPKLRLALESTFPVQTYLPFVIGQPLEKVIHDFSPGERPGSRLWVEGGVDLSDPHDSWAFTGGGKLENMSYKGVPFVSAACELDLSHHALDFHDGRLVFDYRDYPLRKSYDGPLQAAVDVGRIRYESASKTVLVERVGGAVWAAPLVRLFAPKVANSLEEYRFHRPPTLLGSGVVDVTSQGRTSLVVDFSSSSQADYRFLGENITLSEPSGQVRIRGGNVLVEDLRAGGFGGRLTAGFESRGSGDLRGEVSWTKISLEELARTYGFKMEQGTTTGRIEFGLVPGNVRSMSGTGLFALEQTRLFSVPLFGPLSPLISGVLNNDKVGFEHARDAFCTFEIRNGVLGTQDFRTSTKSLSFQGDAKVDLSERVIDMTMKMNAQGLLGLITLPLRPLYGLFEFRGTGPLRQPKWENVVVSPGENHHPIPDSESDKVPRAAPVIEE